MSVLGFTTGDRFRFTVTKYLATNPERKWDNNYEAVATADGVESDLTLLADRLVNFERDLHLDVVVFDRVRISTWEEDSKPYDPEVFISLPLSGVGDLPATGSDLQALNVCLSVARFPQSGRFGHVFYRGCLREVDTSAPAGKFVLSSPSGWVITLNGAVDDNSLTEYLDGTGSVLNLAMINKSGTQVRPIVSLVVRGVAVVPYDHAWFNRTSSEEVSP